MAIPAILNIGLAIGQTGQLNTVAQVAQALERAGFAIRALEVAQSSTEPTAIVSVHVNAEPGQWNLVSQALYGVSVALAQDCIAVHWPNLGYPAGSLIGPAAEKWGAFNPEFFLLPGGAPLALPLPSAA